MKKFFVLFATGILFHMTVILSAVPSCDFVFINSNNFISQQGKKLTAIKTVYICPMHSEIIQDKTGKCPKCGMDLKAKQVKTDVYTCSMHPEIVQDKQGKCPKCGMNLALREPQKASKNDNK